MAAQEEAQEGNEGGVRAGGVCAGGLAAGIEVEYSDRVNFAMQQNGVALVERVAVTNEGDGPLRDVVVTVSLENGECEAWSARIERIEPGGTFSLQPQGLELSARRLAARTESERTALLVEVTDGEGAVARSIPVELLAFDQWPGSGLYPELLAAFVTPNHPRVAEMLGSARESLVGLSGRDGLDGYQAGSRQRASHIAEACFNAALARGIGYINPPASFDRDGQRIRMVDRLCRENLGSCLDLSLLLASLWEQAGLHPIVLLIEGHAMAAVWTHEAHLPDPAIDEPARIRNLVELGELLCVEATHLTQAGASFEVAVESAKRKLVSPGGMFCAVDIRSARKRKVRPLPLRDEGEATSIDLATVDVARAGASATTFDRVALADRVEGGLAPGTSVGSSAGAPGGGPIESGAERILRWQTRLLDLSLVNRLINFRQTGRTIHLKVPEIAAFENLLAEEQRFTINPSTQGDEAFVREQLDARHVYTAETAAETEKRLLLLYRLRRTTVEETGANPLHLALGMLKWFESSASETPRYAPLILLPVQLHRQAAGSGYRYDLSLSEEPLRPNVTLLEKLRTEFGLDTSGLEDLPEDERGVDVPLILRNFRSAIRDMSRWEVEESAFLGLFSFNKFLMWRDLQENMGLLRESRLVEHLVDREAKAFDSEAFPDAARLDDEVAPDQLYCTRDADSSQIAAIRAASGGRTFVLEGPPGTGKSQTIANMIADCLARGKRVLFVAEKMAALGVVHSRLDQDGLGPFCLELHSAKASKKEVLVQLEAALNAAGSAKPGNWAAICGEVGRTRSQLNEYIRELHKLRETGESLYTVLGRLSLLEDGPRVSLPVNDVRTTSQEQLVGWRARTLELASRAEAIDPPHEHPLRGIGRSEWEFGLPDEARAVLTKAESAIKGLREALGGFLGMVGAAGGERVLDRAGARGVGRAAQLFLKNPSPPRALLVGADAAGITAELRKLLEVGRQRDARRGQLLKTYREEFLEIEHLPHLDAVGRAAAKPGLLRWIFGMLAQRKLRVYCTGRVPSLECVLADLENARAVKQASAQLAGATDAASVLGRRWKGGDADWAELAVLLDWCDAFRAATAGLGTELIEALATAASDPAASGANGKVRPLALAVVEAQDGWDDAWRAVDELLKVSDGEGAAEGGWIDAVGGSIERWLKALAELNDWCGWRQSRDTAISEGLGDLAGQFERGAIARGELGDVFERSFGQMWFNAVADSVDAVRKFNASAHGKAVTRFGEVDRALIDCTKSMVTAQLSANAPATSAAGSGQSEIGILRRELQKKRRHLPTRRLIEAMPTLLPRLKPCFLMSPLSVAQYLDAKLPKFDLVIFDEASQIPVWDSIGTIARGADVVVVGDSKQLPPTSFFNTIDGDNDEPEDSTVEDMESILQECNAAGIPAMWLGWHYRSQHESLIAFSNHHYYENRLHTFPSPEARSTELGVTFHHVESGVYDRGGSRTNRVEAAAVVEEVVRLLRDSTAPDSIGIVTFNQAQQSLIEDLLDTKRRECPEIEQFFGGERDEPVFIKNLENVQGDERDTIIFSVGYGPDQTGKVSMNFGPLNGEGGERRLNVAVTRARRRLMVFSSLRSDQIDLKRTRAVGVRHFKTFLDYAARGPLAIAEAIDYSGNREFESGFEHAVWKALVDRGWEVDAQVGCAGYRVDLAVRDPERPGRYVLGIECDGAAYHSAKTARDRDRLRQSVLESLGWRMARIWSLEWRINKDRCLAAVEQAIRDGIDCAKVERGEVLHAGESVGERVGGSAGGDGDDGGSTSVEGESTQGGFAKDGVEAGRDGDEQLKLSLSADSSMAADVVAEDGDAPPAEHVSKFARYQAAEAMDDELAGLDICDDSAMDAAVRALAEIVRVEGPIVQELALRRLSEWFGVTRVRERVRTRFAEILDGAVRADAVKVEDDAIWPGDLDTSTYGSFRTPGEAERDCRAIEEIPLAERRNAVVHVLREQFGLPREELEREVTKLFGLQRLTARVRDVIGVSIDAAVAAGLAVQSGEQVRLGEERADRRDP